ncbi:MAG TPA: GNAT family N-acetyltransferase [Polyangiaceae bacterium]|nr:GNAT family N-acetyltransferase [Polyangiaceae bacterium]
MDGRLHVRPALAGDIDAIARIHVRAWQHAYRGQIPDDVLAALDARERAARWREWLERPDHVLQVAVRERVIVGFCSLIRARDADAKDTDGEIAALYVDPESWRTGAGAALVDAAVVQAHALGYRVLTLWVLVSNASARRFYERVGFSPDGESKVETRPGYSLAEMRYRRELDASPAGAVS